MEGYELQLNPSINDMGYGRQHAQPQSDFFHPLDCEPTLHIGYAALISYFLFVGYQCNRNLIPRNLFNPITYYSLFSMSAETFKYSIEWESARKSHYFFFY